MDALRHLARDAAEVGFYFVLFPLWPLLRAWSIVSPTPFPPAMTTFLEGPIRRRFQDREECLRRSGLAAGQRVLEIGPGGGYVTEGILGRLEAAGRLVCLDIQPAMLQQVRAR